ncbi:MAG TPA: apolipoprotein N-acyltransferase [Segeticoccus sp.]|uniref:apolipoprotein N-acyltransferase n=1 Tax=Segeticoccus sp. TaxID=2706531 RepID=UPI002D808325|nr:apolipoprotein N-acyltransferase [Segeticoccus sp.]HET8598930.1 apolipoprotein N-acyltransferase [Segeticoccus sp.]
MLPRSLLAVLSGLAIWLAFPSANLWPLAIVGVALLALATRGASAWQGLLYGFLSGAACFLPLLHWTGIYVGDLPWVALCVAESLYIAVLGLGSALVQRVPSMAGPERVRPVAIALLWVGEEWLRARVPFGGFPWGRLGFSQADSPLAHLAAWAGAPAVTFGVALAGGVLAAALARGYRGHHAQALGIRRVRAWATLPGLALTAAIVAAPLLITLPTNGPRAQVMGIQGNVPTAGLDFNAQRRAVLDNHARVTRTAAKAVRAGKLARPDLVVWPENSSDIDPIQNADAAAEIHRVVQDIDAPLIIGAVLNGPAPYVSNASLLYRPGKGLTGRYIKRHPVPFAEYIPYRSFFRHFSDKVDLVRRDFIAGTKVKVFDVPSRHAGEIKAGPIICFEIAYGPLVRDTVRAGANLLVVQTNNATFGYTAESEQQLAISRIEAIAHARSIVHVSTVGVSALVTPDGRAHEKTSLFTPAVLSGGLPLRTQLTVADRLGAWPETGASALAALLVLGAAISGRADTLGRKGHRRPARGEARR